METEDTKAILIIRCTNLEMLNECKETLENAKDLSIPMDLEVRFEFLLEE